MTISQIRNLRCRTVARAGLFSCLLFGFALISACKTSEDATAAASQMAAASQDLASYYSALSQVIDNTTKLEQLQSALLGTPFEPQDIAQLQDTQQEVQKRANLAKTLQSLSSDFSKLTGSTATSDVSASANRLGAELVSIKALPTGPPVPDALGKAGKIIILLTQEHDERKMAASLDSTVSAVSKLFTAEKPAYESLYTTYLVLAGSLAKESIKRNWVNESVLLTPALQPFGLSPSAASPEQSLSTVLNSYARQRITTRTVSQTAAQQKASEGMDQALQEMSKRMHKLATERAMSLRGDPVTLPDVENWLSQL